jgi:hypothetical protein
VPVSQYLTFAVTGLFSFFGHPTIAIPYLLDLMRIPSDTYRYFLVVDNLVGDRFGTLLAAMYTLVLAILGASAVSGLLRVNGRRLLRYVEIRERGYLRVGYFDDALPFAFVNQAGKLVGFDVEMAYTLAEGMNVRLELVRIERARAAGTCCGADMST